MPKTLGSCADPGKAGRYRDGQGKMGCDRDGSDRKRSGKPWLGYEVEMILEREHEDRMLAKVPGRSVAAIQIKRAKVKGERSDH